MARPDLLRSLIKTCGPDEAERVLTAYLDASRPSRWAATEGQQFADWLDSTGHIHSLGPDDRQQPHGILR